MLYNDSPIFPYLFFASLLLIPVAALIFRFALRGPRRLRNTPVCPKCSYPLTGLTLPTPCPECGTPVTPDQALATPAAPAKPPIAATKPAVTGGGAAKPPQAPPGGRRASRPALLTASASLLAVAGALLFFTFGEYYYPRIPWMNYRPAFLLVSDFRAPPGHQFNAATKELLRRISAHSLSDANLRAAVAALLAECTKSGANAPTAILLLTLDERHVLTPDEARSFLRARMIAALTARPNVVTGDPVPIQLSFYDKVGVSLTDLSVTPIAYRIDDGPPRPITTFAAWSSHSYDHPDRLRTLAACDTLGQHTIHLTVRVQPSSAHNPAAPPPPPVSVDMTFSAPFAVIPADQSPPLVSTRTASLDDQLRRSLAGNWINVDPQGSLSFTLRSDNSPTDLAYDVFVRTDNTDYPVGSLTLARGETHSLPLSFPTIPGHPLKAPVDVVLRPNPDLVRQTPDLTTYADVPLVLRDVLLHPAPTTRPH